MTRIKVVYWALMSVLGALTFFLLAAGARLLRWRLGDGDGPGGGGSGTAAEEPDAAGRAGDVSRRPPGAAARRRWRSPW